MSEPTDRPDDATARAIVDLRDEAGVEWEQADPRLRSAWRLAHRRSAPLPTDLDWLELSEHLMTGLVYRAVEDELGARVEAVRWHRPTAVAEETVDLTVLDPATAGGRVEVDLVGTYGVDLAARADAVRDRLATVLAATLGPAWRVDLAWVDLEEPAS